MPPRPCLYSLYRFLNVPEISSHLPYKHYVYLPHIALPKLVAVVIVSTRVMHATDEEYIYYQHKTKLQL
jgi:hypothetical protein